MLAILLILFTLFLNPKPTLSAITGEVVEIVSQSKIDQNQSQWIKIKLSNSNEVIINHQSQPLSSFTPYKVGEKVILTEQDGEFIITDYQRVDSLKMLFICFAVLAIIIAGKEGLLSIISMFVSFFILLKFTLPNLTSGQDPVLNISLTCLLIAPIIFYLSHGINKKTNIALLGTVIGIIFTSILAKLAINFTHLSGFASEEASFVAVEFMDKIDIRGLLLSGMIIGLLGVLDDITISQTSIVAELQQTNPSLSKTELYKKAMRVGKDHLSSMINTLILVYAGASLPLLMLFYQNGISIDSLNPEIIAEEIVRTLIGSIGIMIVVPLTTLIAANAFSTPHKSPLAKSKK